MHFDSGFIFLLVTGIDFLYIEDDSLYLWRYTDYDGGEFEPQNFTGMIMIIYSHPTQPSLPLSIMN